MSFAERFEDLRIWQEAREQVFAIYPRNACECWKVDSANGSASGSASSSPSNVPTFKLSHSTPEDFWALKNVSFEVEKAKWSASSAAIALASGSSNVQNAVKMKDITVDPEILGGIPVFSGTRVPVQNLFDYLEAGESVVQFIESFPDVTREQAIAVLEASKSSILREAECVP